MDFIRDVNETFDGILQQLNEPSEGQEAILPLTDWVEQELSARKGPSIDAMKAIPIFPTRPHHFALNIAHASLTETFRGRWCSPSSPENTVMRC